MSSAEQILKSIRESLVRGCSLARYGLCLSEFLAWKAEQDKPIRGDEGL